jgi:adenylate cyclase
VITSASGAGMQSDTTRAAILIVDGDELDRDLLRAGLRLAGFHNLHTAGTGRAALERVAAEMPDLILLDALLPDLNGEEVTRRIRAAYPGEFIPIIMLSVLPATEDRIRGIQAGANDYVAKPISLEELVARMNSLLSLKQTRDDLQRERERMTLLYNVSRALTARLDYQAVLRQIAALSMSITGADKALLAVLAADGSFQEKVLACAGEPTRLADTIEPRVLKDGLLGWVIEHREGALLPDVASDPRWAQLPGDEDAHSAAAVPLMRGDEVVGALLMVSHRAGAFDADHLDLMTALAGQAAIALENNRLFEQARQQRARAEALINQTGDPVLVVDMEGIITHVNPAAGRTIGLDADTVGHPLDEVFGLSISDLIHRAQERGSAVSGEHTIRADPEDERTYNISVSPIQEVGYMLVWQDITPIKVAEQVRLASERAEHERVREALSRYMSPALIERVLSDRDILIRRERREALVMFADLRGFTRLTVEHSANDVVTLLNDVFSKMMDIVYEHEGVVFDIAGDELMIAFNVPYSQPDAHQRALATAIAMQHRFDEIRRRWARQEMRVGMGIGINAGTVVLGHVGGRARMNYAMVGEAVNVAHQLVDVAKDGQIVVSPDVLAGDLPDVDGIRMEELPSRQVKGTDTPLRMILVTVDK